MITVISIQEQYDKMLKITLSTGQHFFTHKTDLNVNDSVDVTNFMGMIKVTKKS